MDHSPLSQAKIVATMGPATTTEEILLQLFKAGVDVCRINLSHGTHKEHTQIIEKIRRLSFENGYQIAILCDLQGPKLRVGEMLNNGVLLENGQKFTFVSCPCVGDSTQAYMSYVDFPKTVKIGDLVLIDDGKLRLKVTQTNGVDKVETLVENGGILSSKKGVNLPNTRVNLPSLTDKDIEDAKFALAMDVDWLGLSFVRNESDVIELKEFVAEQGKRDTTRILAKIEKPEALDCLSAIIDASDGIMVARGDLGVEVSFEMVPIIQKKIIRECVAKARPVIVATQMLESMISNFVPTRAEANDVANAILDGADAVMLSGETSMGNFPVESVQAMQSIIKWTENNGHRFKPKQKPQAEDEFFLSDTICYTATKMADQTKATVIVIFTDLRKPVMKLASFRPFTKIIVFTTNASLHRSLALAWGVEVFLMPIVERTSEAVAYANQILISHKIIEVNDTAVYVGHIPYRKQDAFNMVRVEVVK
ncbi:MAG: pyruvate kinase [Bacteroidales bacterium]